MNVIWSAEALYELDQIERFIAQNNPQRASEFIETLLQSGDSLAYHPDKGRVVPELSIAAFREVLVGRYRLIYYRSTERIDILTVFEGHRLLRLEELMHNPS
jgi:plasmid stabilization system protein ParE